MQAAKLQYPGMRRERLRVAHAWPGKSHQKRCALSARPFEIGHNGFDKAIYFCMPAAACRKCR